jgi:hypothetical protein
LNGNDGGRKPRHTHPENAQSQGKKQQGIFDYGVVDADGNLQAFKLVF